MITVNISGWKWDNLEDFQLSCEAGDEHFGFPIEGNITNCCMEALENRNSKGVFLFYYINYNFQFVPFLGDPSNFDINLPSDEL